MDTKQTREFNDLITSLNESKDQNSAYFYFSRAIDLLKKALSESLENNVTGINFRSKWPIDPGHSYIPNTPYTTWLAFPERDTQPSPDYLPRLPQTNAIFYGGNYSTNTNFPLDLEARFNSLNNQILELLNLQKNSIEELENLRSDFSSLKRENIALKDVNFILSTQSSSESRIQFIPVEIYLDINDNQISFNVYTAISDFLEFIGFERFYEFDAIKNSWFKRILAKSQKAMTSQEVVDRLKEIEYGVEVNTILKQQSEIDKNQSEALLNILNSVEKVPNAAIRIGALLVVKVTNNEGAVNVQVRTLSIKELHLLNKKPELLHSPQTVLNALIEGLHD